MGAKGNNLARNRVTCSHKCSIQYNRIYVRVSNNISRGVPR